MATEIENVIEVLESTVSYKFGGRMDESTRGAIEGSINVLRAELARLSAVPAADREAEWKAYREFCEQAGADVKAFTGLMVTGGDYPLAYEPWFYAAQGAAEKIGTDPYEGQDEIPQPSQMFDFILNRLSDALFDGGLKGQADITIGNLTSIAKELVAARAALASPAGGASDHIGDTNEMVPRATHERLRDAAMWLACQTPGTPTPDWVDEAVNASPPSPAPTGTADPIAPDREARKVFDEVFPKGYKPKFIGAHQAVHPQTLRKVMEDATVPDIAHDVIAGLIWQMAIWDNRARFMCEEAKKAFAAKDAAEAVLAGQTAGGVEGGWVAVKDRVPDAGARVITFRWIAPECPSMDFANWEGGEWQNYNWHRSMPRDEIDYWREAPPLPPSPPAPTTDQQETRNA
jgi:hypothetical protein